MAVRTDGNSELSITQNTMYTYEDLMRRVSSLLNSLLFSETPLWDSTPRFLKLQVTSRIYNLLAGYGQL